MRPLRATLHPRLLLWLAVAVAIIGGLLGMHALNLHGGGPQHAVSGHAIDAQHEAEPPIASSSTHDHAASPAVPCDDCNEAGGAGHDAAAACVLALLATLLLLPRATTSWLNAVLVHSWTATRAPTVRGTFPLPSLYELSVIRT
ncbi:DUF6153 family protein [Agrococcus sp. SGAir0287]|uniref:DUF6153 family protein n=1 Tax=Agrococcus sp. SGAir0287 TaxID=2070347 RepID=UPI0010CCF1B0|nr:DUF6153 family protein [Agrococcus sp. SGAir0287]QCR19166.1 hypothetical protein C1N71_06725 [Agrococcus sp. SGAir0287]